MSVDRSRASTALNDRVRSSHSRYRCQYRHSVFGVQLNHGVWSGIVSKRRVLADPEAEASDEFVDDASRSSPVSHFGIHADNQLDLLGDEAGVIDALSCSSRRSSWTNLTTFCWVSSPLNSRLPHYWGFGTPGRIHHEVGVDDGKAPCAATVLAPRAGERPFLMMRFLYMTARTAMTSPGAMPAKARHWGLFRSVVSSQIRCRTGMVSSMMRNIAVTGGVSDCRLRQARPSSRGESRRSGISEAVSEMFCAPSGCDRAAARRRGRLVRGGRRRGALVLACLRRVVSVVV